MSAVFGTTLGYEHARAKLDFAKQCLSTYDSTGGNQAAPFRRWLVRQIRDMEAALAKCRARPEQEAAAAE